MKKCLLMGVLMAMVACGADPYDEVRSLRRGYKLNLDLAVSDERGEATYEIEVQNLSGKSELQEVTVLVELLDGEQNVFWSRTHELDVNGLGNYATKTFQYADTIEEPTKYEFHRVILAPDDANSDFKNYKEFMRVVP